MIDQRSEETELTPVEESRRYVSVDMLRGVAVLGILAMNVVAFAWPRPVYDTPTLAPCHTRLDLAIWMLTYIVFDTKMMTIFSMLFGAGLVLTSNRAEEQGRSFGRIYYRRVYILLLIGMVHAYAIWEGDILVLYAICGFALYPFRRLPGPTLVAIGVGLLLLAIPAWLAIRAIINVMDDSVRKVEAGVIESGPTLALAKLRKGLHYDDPTRRKHFDEAIEVHRSGYRRIARHRAPEVFENQILGVLLEGWWQVGGRMLIGMGLMKLGVFTARRSRADYVRMAAAGYGIGLPLVVVDIIIDLRHDFFINDDLAYATGGWWLIREVSGPFLTLGHVAVMMLIYQSGAAIGLTRRLAAVGRMALSNYLMQSLICTTIFYGYGFGLYARVGRTGLALIVLAIWAFQLWLSPVWLARFRYGPAEWFWRSLTYGTSQAMRRP